MLCSVSSSLCRCKAHTANVRARKEHTQATRKDNHVQLLDTQRVMFFRDFANCCVDLGQIILFSAILEFTSEASTYMYYDQSMSMYYDHSACMYNDHSICMDYDHSTCMYYEHSTCMYYVHTTCMYNDHSTCVYYDHSTCGYFYLQAGIGVWSEYRLEG